MLVLSILGICALLSQASEAGYMLGVGRSAISTAHFGISTPASRSAIERAQARIMWTAETISGKDPAP
jgi:hypothetical protein